MSNDGPAARHRRGGLLSSVGLTLTLLLVGAASSTPADEARIGGLDASVAPAAASGTGTTSPDAAVDGEPAVDRVLEVSEPLGSVAVGQEPVFASVRVRGSDGSVGRAVRLVLRSSTGAVRESAPVVLTPWWQTVGVTSDPSEASGTLEAVLQQTSDGQPWADGDSYEVAGFVTAAAPPTVTATSGRQLLVDGDPYVMRGYVYFPTPPGTVPQAAHWNTNPAQCQSDAELLAAAGVNTLRIFYVESSYDEASYDQCMDAFHAHGIGLLWIVYAPGGANYHVGDGQADSTDLASDAYLEAYRANLELAVTRLKDHPATLGWAIGNEMSRSEPLHRSAWLEDLDDLAALAKSLDPHHVTTTALTHGQFQSPLIDTAAPNVDMWGVNMYGDADGYPASTWADVIASDPDRPVWISEYGTDRFRCQHIGPTFGLQIALNPVSCVDSGSYEDGVTQGAWDAAAWEDMAANLSAVDPANAVVGGTAFMWSDVWWFAIGFYANGTPLTHDVSGPHDYNPITGAEQGYRFFGEHFPDKHFSPEFIGTTLNLPQEAPGPRVSTLGYDGLAAAYTGLAWPEVSDATVTASGPCQLTVTWTTSVPTYGRIDLGLENKVAASDIVHSVNTLPDVAHQGTTLTSSHAQVVDGLVPGQVYRVYPRGFDGSGRPGTTDGINATTLTEPCPPVGADVADELRDELAGQPAQRTGAGGPPLVANGSFEAPDVSAYDGTAGATTERVETSFRGAHALAVTSSGLDGSGVATEAVRDTDAGSHLLTLAVKGTSSSHDQVVRAVLTDPDTGERTTSAPVHLTLWWQTVAVSATTSGTPLQFALEESGGDGDWAAGDRYLVDIVDARATGPTKVSTSGRQLLVDDVPYTMKGYVYMAVPPGGFANLLTWNTNPAQCQSDARLLAAAGVNTLRIWYQEAGYEPTTYRQCMDAFHGAGVKLMWLIQPPSGFQVQENVDAYVEAYWEHLRLAVERVKDHPATLGYNIGNEMKRAQDESNGWFPQVDELARRTKQLDPLHVATTAINHPQFFGRSSPGGDGIQPDEAPNIDLWGLNLYGNGQGMPDGIWDQLKTTDPSRPVWISEFGTDRYRCNQRGREFGTQIVTNFVSCAAGSGEDQAPQAAWDAAQWQDIAANLSADDPEGAVVGGTLFMWSDAWWFSFPIFTGSTTTPFTHDVTGVAGTNPINGQGNPFVRAHFPDQHFSPEWIGTTLTLPLEAPGPRATSLAYDRMGLEYTGVAHPVITTPQVQAGACSATLTWTSDVPTYARADFGRTVYVGTRDAPDEFADALVADNFLTERWVQDDTLRTSHSVTLTGLAPGQGYRVHVRGFDELGRSGTQPPVEFTTSAGACA